MDPGISANKERFLDLCYGIEREGIGDLTNWLSKSDFFTCPASSRFHGAYEGGLLEHSLNVYEEAERLLKAYPELDIPEDSIRITTLFHDLCKVNMYETEKRNRKNESGQWESYDAYVINEKFCFGGHGSKSVFIVQNFVHLKPEEASAINCHMGAFQEGAARDVGNAFEKYPLAWITHVADESATYIKEANCGKKD